jgi:hypothetical protein
MTLMPMLGSMDRCQEGDISHHSMPTLAINLPTMLQPVVCCAAL